jgi:hypothetical protein
MERLFERKEIHVAAHGPASRGWSHIARGAKERYTERWLCAVTATLGVDQAQGRLLPSPVSSTMSWVEMARHESQELERGSSSI